MKTRTTLFFSLIFFVFTFTQAQYLVEGKMLQKDSLIDDLILLESALKDIHPGVYRYNTPEDISNGFTALKNNLPSEISEAEFLKRLAQTIQRIRCGHTYLNPWNMNRGMRERLFNKAIYMPIGFKMTEEGTCYVTHNASGNTDIQIGAELRAINSVSMIEIFESLKSIVKIDGANDAPVPSYLSLQDFRERHWNTFELYFPLFFPMEDSLFHITYQNPGAEEIMTAAIQGLRKKEREEKMKEKYGEGILENKDWTLRIESDLATMKLGTFAIWNWEGFDHKKWFQNAFDSLNEAGVKNLVIDIRGNGGGLAEPKDELLSYLISDTLGCETGRKVLVRTTKVDSSYTPYVDTWEKILFQGLPEGAYRKYDDTFFELSESFDCEKVIPKTNGFNGDVYIFGGESNVSATFDLLSKFQNLNLGTYVGNSSGGNKQGINGGSYFFFYLPYSKMEVDIPLKYFAPPQKQQDEGLRPDVLIKYSQEDIAQGKDPHLDYVKSLIR